MSSDIDRTKENIAQFILYMIGVTIGRSRNVYIGVWADEGLSARSDLSESDEQIRMTADGDPCSGIDAAGNLDLGNMKHGGFRHLLMQEPVQSDWVEVVEIDKEDKLSDIATETFDQAAYDK